jgi:hypothetical protein
VSPRKKTEIARGKEQYAVQSAAAAPAANASESEFERAEAAAKYIFSQTSLRPKIALILGSGLGAFAEEFSAAARISYAKIPHFPQSTAIGHAGQLVIGKVGQVAVAGMQGRVHLYEGYSVKEVTFPVRVFVHGGEGRDPHKRSRGDQARICAGESGGDQGPHQSPRGESTFGTE